MDIPPLRSRSAARTRVSVHAGVDCCPEVHYRTMSIDGVNVFYREAGPADAPAVVLLHGFPSSSNMFRNLIPALADRYHVIAPDYPGFGHSDMPDRTSFATASLTSQTSPTRC